MCQQKCRAAIKKEDFSSLSADVNENLFLQTFALNALTHTRDILTLKITHNHSFELILAKCRHHGTTIENTGNTVLIQQDLKTVTDHIFAFSMYFFFVYVVARAMVLSATTAVNILQFDGRAAI